ncbi:MAG TPA: hypothetical protein VNC14_01835 [Lapillicoccus sp.]|nr:hypothetical protein [Lapillicoccus sp.]
MDVDLDSAVGELYGLHPDEFLGARRTLAAQAKADKETGLAKAIDSIRKPTAAAWAINQLVRARPADVERLVDLAAGLHEAQEKMDGAALKTLSRERTKLVDELVRSTTEVAKAAGGAMSTPVANQVRETFVAALATTAAAEAVGSGQLTRALSYAGFGDVDLSEATAAPAPARRPALRVIAGEGKGSGRSGRGRAADPEPEPEKPAEPDPALLKRLSEAEKRSRETMSAAAEAGDALSEAIDALEALDARIADLDADLKAARASRDGLAKAQKEAAAANKVAERTLRAALAEVDQIRAKLPDTDDD